MENPSDQKETPQSGAFLKSLIKINHPDWTTEEIESEFQRQMKAKENQQEDNGCEACSG